MPCECRQIDARNWENGSDFDWGSAYFFRVFTPLFFHIPYRVDRDIEMARFEITALGYKTKHPLKIVTEDGWFRGAVLIEIEKPDRPDPKVVQLGRGKYFSKLSALPWKELGKATMNMLKEHSLRPAALYFWYLSCPVCSEAEGYRTVIIAKSRNGEE